MGRVSLVLLSLLAGCVLPGEHTAAEDSIANGLDDGCKSELFAKLAARVQSVSGLIPAGLVVTTHNAASERVQIGGDAIFGAIADAIEVAEHDVALQTWRWDPGSVPARAILSGIKRLEARRQASQASAPVLVRILVNRNFPQTVNLLTHIGASLAGLELDPALVEVQFVDFRPVGLGASHAKTVIVDGKTALLTGANVATGYGGAGPEWFDAGFSVSGEVAQALYADFAATWRKGFRWLCGAGYDVPPPTGEWPAQVDPCWDTPPPATTLIPTPVAEACLPMLVASHVENGSLFPFARVDNPQAQLFLGAIEAANHIVRLQTPNLNEDAMKLAIVAAVRRGVIVHLLLSKQFEETGESLPGRGGGNERTVAELTNAVADLPDGCKVLQIHWYSTDGATAVSGTPPPASHVKYLSIDGQVAIVGSANQDVQSWRNSHEVNVALDSAATTRAWDAQLFEPSWAFSVPIERCLN